MRGGFECHRGHREAPEGKGGSKRSKGKEQPKGAVGHDGGCLGLSSPGDLWELGWSTLTNYLKI